MEIRKALVSDADQIAELYNYYVLNTHHNFEMEAVSLSEMEKRIIEISENYPYLAYVEGNEILGYTYAALYKTRAAYKNSVEISVYVKNGVEQKGIGTKLYAQLFEELAKTNIHAIIAGIALPNDVSIKLHEKFGMEKIAHFREVGFKLGRWIDVGYWELIN